MGKLQKRKTCFSFLFTILRLSCVLCPEPISDGAKNFSSGVHGPDAVAVGIQKDVATTWLSLRESDGCGWGITREKLQSSSGRLSTVIYFYASVKVKKSCCFNLISITFVSSIVTC